MKDKLKELVTLFVAAFVSGVAIMIGICLVLKIFN